MDQLREFVKTGKAKETVERVQILLDEGKEPNSIMKDALIPAMDEVGDLFQKGEYFVPEMLVAARAMQKGLEVLKPKLVDSGIEPIGKILVGTVKGDLHDIGKNLVVMALEGAGFEVIDLGTDVAPDKFVEAIREHKPKVIGLSALLTTTMLAMRDTINAIKSAGLRDQVKIMIGGAPIRQEFCDEIGADFYGPDSTSGRNFARDVVTGEAWSDIIMQGCSMYGKKLKSALMLLAVCMIFSPRSSITAETSYRTSEYPQMKKALMKGWNTWDTRSVLTHVLLPEGLAVQLQLKSNKTGKILKTALIGRQGKKEEQISPSLRSYDGSYTDLSLRWQGINIRVQSAAINNNLVILVEPDQGSGLGQLIIRPEMFYGREGRIEFGRDMIVARLPSRTAGVFVDGKSPPVFSRHLAMELDGPIGISIGAELSREEIEDIISTARENLLRSKAKYGDLINVHNAQQTALAWNVIYEPTQDRVITPVSRIWNIAWGGYVLFDWDTYFAAYMMSMDSRELAYANAIEVTRGITEDGFIPNYTHPGIWSHKKIQKSRDRSQPPVGSLVVREIYRKYREKWFLEETFDDLLTWNRWWDSNRVTQGYLCWGSNPYWETGRRNPNPMNTDGGKGCQGDTSGQQKPKDSSIEVASSAMSNFELEPSDFGVFFPHVIYLTDRFFAANKHQGAAWESGLDNSPMYDDIPFNKKTHMMELADVGLISMYIMDCEALADIADELGKTEESAELRARADKYRASLAGLWEDEFGLYLNRRTDTGELSSRISPTNFYPLLARAPSPEQARRMMKEHFDNPEEFWGEYIMPSIARNDPAFADNVYWRGRIWAPMNFLVYMGMRNYDLPEARRDLVEKSRDLLLKSWLSEGHVYENYNATTGVGDDVGNSDKFYHWGALLGFISFIEEGFVSRPEESL